jgi:enoyl-CoA hydratase
MGNHLTIQRDGNVAHITLDDGRANALGSHMMQAILDAVNSVADADAVLLTGREKVFCGGLDLAEAVPLPLDGIRRFMGLFHDTFRALLALERPLVVAAQGGAVAGGAVLLCCGDVRLGARDKGLVGVNEVQLGIPFPTTALEAVRSALASPQASQALLEGTLFTKEQALTLGYFHALHEPADLLARAQERVRQLAQLPASATGPVKRALRQEHLERVDRHGHATTEHFAQVWTGAAAQARLNQVLSRLKK